MTPDDSALAAELTLGLLEAEELTAARARLLSDRAFAAEVAHWQAWLAPLAYGFAEVPPPPALEERVMRAIAPTLPAERPRGRRWAVLALAALAAALLVLVLGPLRAPRPVPVPGAPLLAALSVPADQQEAGRIALAAVADRSTGEIRIAAPAAVPAQRVAQLWLIGADGAAPVPVGLLARGAPTRVVVPAGARALLRPGTTVAVSIEPDGGSPTGAPTGPVIAAGPLADG